ncbi:MAG: type I DNA topoisomerase [Kiloniellales bacterium]
MNIVVVESPAKAKTINKYLGKDYQVLASFGHVRDLPSKDGSVQPDSDFAMSWEVDGRAEKRLKEIAAAVKKADKLILATDPDREGEAISWHIMQEMQRRRALSGKEVERVVFNEITKKAVNEAFRNPRGLDDHLVQAYLARRALDYLVGFTLSPLLWRKLPGSRSAGRVQSVALRLICEREAEIEIFKPREYWTVDADLETADKAKFRARLTHLAGRKLDRFDINDEAKAKAAVAQIEAASRFEVAKVEAKQVKRNPAPPFTTSTLQQEASRRLGFGASRTMRVAQKLYEGVDLGGDTVGLITYMRTDGVQLAGEAIASARRVIAAEHGESYLPPSPRQYKSKAKNAQEAHEAIRPTDLGRLPAKLQSVLNDDELKLYRLIWQRTLASQMASAVLDQVAVDVAVDGNSATLHATGSTIRFDGFLRLYRDVREEDAKAEDGERRLPPLTQEQALALQEVVSEQHFTQPPPRYSEASLIKKLEELGIGRPSTYTSILQVLQDRDYVRLEKRRFIPEDRGRVVTAFLTAFFNRYVEYDFTAVMEEQLDDISGGRIDYLKVLRDFWGAFEAAVEEAKGLRISDVIDTLDEALGPHFFPVDAEAPDKNPRLCPTCGSGRLGLRLGKRGGFIGCSNYPECKFTRPLSLPTGDDDAANGNTPRELGIDPESGLQVSLRVGPYGPYVQLGEGGENGEKPKRSSLQKGQDPNSLDLPAALGLLALPRDVGEDPETGEPILAAIGRFGPYLKCGTIFANLKGGDEVLTVGLNRAVTLIAEARQKKRENTRELGVHPKNKKPIEARRNRFGIEVVWGKTKVRLPKGTDLDSVTLEQAVAVVDEKVAKEKAAKGSKTKSTTKKAAPKKAAAKKTTAKKTTSKTAAKSAS